MKRTGNMLIVVLILGMLICGLGICLRPGAVVNAQVPYIINYQGKLTDSSGNPLNGDYDMTFLLYEDETGGTHIWIEQQTVTVIDGLLNVKLGTGTGDPLFPDLFETDTLYLEIQIKNQSDTFETMTPRHRLTSTAFAMKAESAGSAGTAGGNSLGAADGDPADVVYVDNNGNVGIGTTSPSYALHVLGDIYATVTIHGASGTGDTDWVESGGNI